MMPQTMKTKNGFEQVWRWDRNTFWRNNVFSCVSTFCWKSFEKQPFFPVWTRVIENFFEKRLFLREWQRLHEQVFGNIPFFACWQRCFRKVFREKTFFSWEDVFFEKFFKPRHACSVWALASISFKNKNNFYSVWTRFPKHFLKKVIAIWGMRDWGI